MKGQSAQRVARPAPRTLTPADHALRSNLAASAITRLPAFKPGARVAVYLPFDRETNTAALLIAARRRRVRIYVPVIESRRHARLRFYPLTGKTRRGVFGISVPHGAARRHTIAPRWFDLIVVPLVGVDGEGRRLGMGGGFYDRALAFRRTRHCWRGPCLVGLAFECQRADSRVCAGARCPPGCDRNRMRRAALPPRSFIFSKRGFSMNHWLLKSEPGTFSIDDLAAAPRRTTAWDGVRNYQARNMLRDSMKKGDTAFFYHSSCEIPGIAGIVRIVKEGYPDKTAFDPKDRSLRSRERRKRSSLVRGGRPAGAQAQAPHHSR